MRRLALAAVALSVAYCTQQKGGSAPSNAVQAGGAEGGLTTPSPASPPTSAPTTTQARPDNAGVTPPGWLSGAIFSASTITIGATAQPAGFANLSYQFCAAGSPSTLSQLVPGALPGQPLADQTFFYWVFADHDPAQGPTATRLTIRIDGGIPGPGPIPFTAKAAPNNVVTLVSSRGNASGTWTSSSGSLPCVVTIGGTQYESGTSQANGLETDTIYVPATMDCGLTRSDGKASLQFTTTLGCEGPAQSAVPTPATEAASPATEPATPATEAPVGVTPASPALPATPATP